MPPSAEVGAVPVVLCWDIDGTLLTTDRAGIGAWEDALRDVCGVERSLADWRTAGLTDVEIGCALLERDGIAPEPELVARLLTRYEDRLPVRLGDRRGRVLPGVIEFLAWNRSGPGLPCILLTGNTERGAAAKLRHYGLDIFFELGAFAGPAAGERAAVARSAVPIAARWLGSGFDPRRMLVIGDTPHDVSCGAVIGARVLAVATGGYALDELRQCRPWRVLPSLPEPQALAALALEDLG